MLVQMVIAATIYSAELSRVFLERGYEVWRFPPITNHDGKHVQ